MNEIKELVGLLRKENFAINLHNKLWSYSNY